MVTKVCTKCGEEKPLDAFTRHPGGRYGRHPRCRDCRNAAERARYRANREQILERMRSDPRRRDYGRWRRRIRDFGVTSEAFLAMAEAQGGRCAICGAAPDDVFALCVDHDHDTGAVRGLLCAPCNLGIGSLGDDPERCRSAARYLEDRPGRTR